MTTKQRNSDRNKNLLSKDEFLAFYYVQMIGKFNMLTPDAARALNHFGKSTQELHSARLKKLFVTPISPSLCERLPGSILGHPGIL